MTNSSILFNFNLICNIYVKMVFLDLKELIFKVSIVFMGPVWLSQVWMNIFHDGSKYIIINAFFIRFNQVHIQKHG